MLFYHPHSIDLEPSKEVDPLGKIQKRLQSFQTPVTNHETTKPPELLVLPGLWKSLDGSPLSKQTYPSSTAALIQRGSWSWAGPHHEQREDGGPGCWHGTQYRTKTLCLADKRCTKQKGRCPWLQFLNIILAERHAIVHTRVYRPDKHYFLVEAF